MLICKKQKISHKHFQHDFSAYCCLWNLIGSRDIISFKGTVMQIEKVLINDRLRVSKVS